MRLRGKQCPKAIRGVVTLISNPTAIEATQTRIADGRNRSRPQKAGILVEAQVRITVVIDVVKLGLEPIDRLDAGDTRQLQCAPIELNARRAAEAVVRARIGGVECAAIHANGGGTRDEGVRRVIDGNRARSAKPQGLSHSAVIVVCDAKCTAGVHAAACPGERDAGRGDRTAADKGAAVIDRQRTDVDRHNCSQTASCPGSHRCAAKDETTGRTLSRDHAAIDRQSAEGDGAICHHFERAVRRDRHGRGGHIDAAALNNRVTNTSVTTVGGVGRCDAIFGRQITTH